MRLAFFSSVASRVGIEYLNYANYYRAEYALNTWPSWLKTRNIGNQTIKIHNFFFRTSTCVMWHVFWSSLKT